MPRIARLLQRDRRDKRYRVWRAAEEDPDSGLYAESSDMQAIIGYITARS